ncbi:unnamed protein product, partial [Ceratitis capitata]
MLVSSHKPSDCRHLEEIVSDGRREVEKSPPILAVQSAQSNTTTIYIYCNNTLPYP